jgi:hypothetical protein
VSAILDALAGREVHELDLPMSPARICAALRPCAEGLPAAISSVGSICGPSGAAPAGRGTG